MSDSAWFAVVDPAGTLVSLGSVVASPLPAGLDAVQLSPADAAAIREGHASWDAETRCVVILPPPVPVFVTRWQFRRWLVDHAITPESVEAMIAATISDPLERARALVDWRDGPIVRRDHPLLAPMAAALGLTETAVDTAFREAAEYA